MLEAIKQLKSEHPFWGYRRIWAHLRYRQQLTINQKRVYRLMRENKLLASRKNTTRALRAPKSKPRADAPSQFWGTDMTKIYIEGNGWAYITVVLDWFTKKNVGPKEAYLAPRNGFVPLTLA